MSLTKNAPRSSEIVLSGPLASSANWCGYRVLRLLYASRDRRGWLAMLQEIDRVFTKYPFFGSRQIAAYLRREDIVVGRHRIRRLMTSMGLEAIYKRPRASQPQPCRYRHPYLLRKMSTDRLYQKSIYIEEITDGI